MTRAPGVADVPGPELEAPDPVSAGLLRLWHGAHGRDGKAQA